MFSVTPWGAAAAVAAKPRTEAVTHFMVTETVSKGKLLRNSIITTQEHWVVAYQNKISHNDNRSSKVSTLRVQRDDYYKRVLRVSEARSREMDHKTLRTGLRTEGAGVDIPWNHTLKISFTRSVVYTIH